METLLQNTPTSLPVIPLDLGTQLLGQRRSPSCHRPENPEALTSFALVLIEDLPQLLLLLPGLCLAVRRLHGHLGEKRAPSAPQDPDLTPYSTPGTMPDL